MSFGEFWHGFPPPRHHLRRLPLAQKMTPRASKWLPFWFFSIPNTTITSPAISFSHHPATQPTPSPAPAPPTSTLHNIIAGNWYLIFWATSQVHEKFWILTKLIPSHHMPRNRHLDQSQFSHPPHPIIGNFYKIPARSHDFVDIFVSRLRWHYNSNRGMTLLYHNIVDTIISIGGTGKWRGP